MLAKVFSGAVLGLESVPITIEVDIASRALPHFQIVGLADKAVEESKERVRSAIQNSSLDFPIHKITVNLAPADLPKEGALYDLPIALGLLLGNESLKVAISDCLFLGELSLDGGLRSTPGVLPIALMAKDQGFKHIFIPQVNAKEAAIISGIAIYAVPSLKDLVDHFLGVKKLVPIPEEKLDFDFDTDYESDFSDIKGQESAKRALEIAAAGSHNVLLKGSPGSGKTLLARTFPSILPKLTEDEAIEITKIYSVSNLLSLKDPVIKKRPFRSPHHTTSHIGLIGGGTRPKPGEISLAHRGVLFLDEIPEFPRHALEALRQPLEDGFVTVSRASGTSHFPSKFTLIAACNPCPCGYTLSNSRKCLCSPHQISQYQKRLSGPFLDRIDLHVFCSDIPANKLSDYALGENSKAIRQRVQKARDTQIVRFNGAKITANSEMSNREVKKYCLLDEKSHQLLTQAVSTLGLSGRGYYRLLKVSRTIADLAESENIQVNHVAEALQYRQKDN